MEGGKIRRCQDQDFVENASAPTIDSLHKSTVKNGSLASYYLRVLKNVKLFFNDFFFCPY